MHSEAFHFFALLRKYHSNFFSDVRVMEAGSYRVNHSVRQLFNRCTYIGIDLVEGPGVDLVANAATVSLDQKVDVAISAECFEHNPYFRETFNSMIACTRPGGLVAFSAASTGRPEHGTTRAVLHESPGTAYVGWDYYRNVIEEDFDKNFLSEQFSDFLFLRNTYSSDIYFLGFVKAACQREKIQKSALENDIAETQRVSVLMPEFWSAKNRGELVLADSIALEIERRLRGVPNPLSMTHVISHLIGNIDLHHSIVKPSLDNLHNDFPMHDITWLLGGKYFAALKEFEDAAVCYSRAIELGDESSTTYYLCGVALLASNAVEAACEHFLKAIGLDADRPWYYEGLFRAQNASQKEANSLQLLDEGIVACSNPWQLMKLKVNYFIGEGKLPEAKSVYHEITQLEHQSAEMKSWSEEFKKKWLKN